MYWKHLLHKFWDNITIEVVAKTNYQEYQKANNDWAWQHRQNIQKTVNEIIAPLVKRFGRLIFNSWVRCPALNEDKRIGGSARSQHVLGDAVDFRLPKNSIFNLIDIFEYLQKNDLFIFGQCIYYEDEGFIHISRYVGRSKRQFMICKLVEGKRTYEKVKVA